MFTILTCIVFVVAALYVTGSIKVRVFKDEEDMRRSLLPAPPTPTSDDERLAQHREELAEFDRQLAAAKGVDEK